MASNHLLLLLLFVMIIGLSGFVGFSEAGRDPGVVFHAGVEGGGSNDSMTCVQKLFPCQPYLKNPEKAPPACCVPLKQMVQDDTKCLCGLFNNPDVLKDLNVTQNDALKLPKACGANADISICKKDAQSPPTSTPATPSAPAASNNSSSSSSSKSAAFAPSHFGGSGFAALFMALIISAFFF